MKSGYQVCTYLTYHVWDRSCLSWSWRVLIFIFVYRLVSITGDPILKLPLALSFGRLVLTHFLAVSRLVSFTGYPSRTWSRRPVTTTEGKWSRMVLIFIPGGRWPATWWLFWPSFLLSVGWSRRVLVFIPGGRWPVTWWLFWPSLLLSQSIHYSRTSL